MATRCILVDDTSLVWSAQLLKENWNGKHETQSAVQRSPNRPRRSTCEIQDSRRRKGFVRGDEESERAGPGEIYGEETKESD
jgi:hypothetical protein